MIGMWWRKSFCLTVCDNLAFHFLKKWKYNPTLRGIIITTTTGIDAINSEDTTSDSYYDVGGRRIQKLQKGLNIVKSSDGKITTQWILLNPNSVNLGLDFLWCKFYEWIIFYMIKVPFLLIIGNKKRKNALLEACNKNFLYFCRA